MLRKAVKIVKYLTKFAERAVGSPPSERLSGPAWANLVQEDGELSPHGLPNLVLLLISSVPHLTWISLPSRSS